MDVQRLASALRGPGVDTRCWVSLAIALGDTEVDKDHGVFVDVKLMPNEEEYTARVPAIYAGAGFGLYSKIRVDDEVAVAIPSGNPAEGAIVISRLWSAADTPPQQVVDNPEDLVLVIEPGKSLRIATSGGGTVVIDSQDVRLGDLDPQELVARADRVEEGLQDIVDAIKGGVPGSADGGAALQTTIVAALTNPVAAVGSDTTKVK